METTKIIHSTTQMTIRDFVKSIREGKVTFENDVQRGFVWDIDRKSYFMDTILHKYPFPELWIRKYPTGKYLYDVIDGKQRAMTIYSFVNGGFALSKMSESLEDYEGLTFDNLDEEDQQAILDYSVRFLYLDGMTDDENNDIFFRINNGKPLTNFEQVKARCKSLKVIQQIIDECDVFDEEKTEKPMTNDKKLELVFKAWVMLFVENPCLEKKALNPIMIQTEITDDQVKIMKAVFGRVFDAIECIKNDSTEESKKADTRAIKRILTPTHLLSIMPFVKRSIDEKITIESFSLWLRSFYNGTKRATSDETYNDNASRGSAKADSIKKRLDCLARSYEVKFLDMEESDETDDLARYF